MPHTTVYVNDASAALWERMRALPGSLTSNVTAALRQYLATLEEEPSLPEGWELADVQRGGAWGAWGARLVWRSETVHVLRHVENRDALIREAQEFARLAGESKLEPEDLRKWSRLFGSLAQGENVY